MAKSWGDMRNTALKGKLTVSTRYSILDPRSSILEAIKNRGPRTEDRESRLKNRVSSIGYRGSRIKDRDDRITLNYYNDLIITRKTIAKDKALDTQLLFKQRHRRHENIFKLFLELYEKSYKIFTNLTKIIQKFNLLAVISFLSSISRI